MMDIQEELRVCGHQPVYGFKGTEERDLFEATIDDLKAKGWNPQENIVFLMCKAYTFGLMRGKREERARKK